MSDDVKLGKEQHTGANNDNRGLVSTVEPSVIVPPL